MFLPYVHLLQLTAHVRKGLLERGNNENERDGELCAVFLFSIWQEASSQQALKDLLFPHRFYQD